MRLRAERTAAAADMSGKPPEILTESGGDPDARIDVGVSIGNVHVHPSDLAELRRIAEIDPSLARAVVDNFEKSDRREQRSFVVAMVITLLALALVIGGTVAMVYLLGLLQSLIGIGVILGLGVFLRVYLTGEWSDTGWIASIIGALRSREKE